MPIFAREKRPSASVDLPSRSRIQAFAPEAVSSPLVQRKVCPCGGGCPRCAAKAEEQQAAETTASVQRSATESAVSNPVPPIVHNVLRSPGQSLDGATRSSFERRFGYDFSSVKVHTDEVAASSAQAVKAQAYTSGPHIVFGRGQYAPSTAEGRKLMAHELAHVIHQRSVTGMPKGISSPCDPLERAAEHTANQMMWTEPSNGAVHAGDAAEPVLSRRVAGVNCPANQDGAGDDPRGNLETADPIAIQLSTDMAAGLATDATTVLGGIPDTPSATLQAYEDHFGLPIAAGAGFLNRLTGVIRPTQERALSEELAVVSRRFAAVARLMSQGLSYNCPGNGSLKLVGCSAGTCNGADAFSCPGNSLLALCASFWTNFDDTARAQILIHECTHISLGNIGVGSILDATTQGSGRNFNIAGCYEALIADGTGADSHVECPAVPGA
jgi:hypothetical protein